MLVHLVGTKAQFIKMAPVIVECRQRRLPMQVIYTGQHSETFTDLEANFGLPGADATLGVGQEASDRQSFVKWLSKAWSTSRSAYFRNVWRQAKCIIVHGDTASTLLGARIARREKVPLAHVEAGLRSFNYLHPFPEEAIRVLVARMATYHFAPDHTAVENLLAANVNGKVTDTHGNTIIDAVRMAIGAPLHPGQSVDGDDFGIFSMHRHENLFKPKRLRAALKLLEKLSEHARMKFVLHPVTIRRLEKTGDLARLQSVPGIELVRRMDFFSFHRLLDGASFVVTDGGSNQEECALLGIPCAVLRRVSERHDGFNDNVFLADLDVERVLAWSASLPDRRLRKTAVSPHSPSKVIVDTLERIERTA